LQGFYNLQPESVLDAAEMCGFKVTGEFTQLNSYENRVFDIKLEDADSIIAKFYRPNRWDEVTILEEHEFLQELKAEGILAVSPLQIQQLISKQQNSVQNNQKSNQKNKVQSNQQNEAGPLNTTLINFQDLWVAFFPKIRARMPQELMANDLKQIGRLMARVHNIGEQKDFKYRPILDSSYYGGWETLDFLQTWIAPEVRHRYNEAAEHIISALDQQVDLNEFIRIHGDCHRGNILTNSQEYFLVDFDDVCMGPAVQDVWMLLSGDEESSPEFQQEVKHFLEGYEELRHFPRHQLDWISILRGIRVIGYAGWIARRWTDPSFPKIFPEFNTYRYWAEEVDAISKIARQIK
jgi:Ser/Thr protein kinase RdoA (MazF antagonist)